MKYLACIMISISIVPLYGSCAVTYNGNRGSRFGDNLLMYCKAKWISEQFKIPLLYVPFDQSNHLILHRKERLTHAKKLLQYRITQPVLESADIVVSDAASILYKAHMNFKLTGYPNMFCMIFDLYLYSREHKDFHAILKREIAPIIPPKKRITPDNCVTVAVHVRKGGGFDMPFASVQIYDDTDDEITYHSCTIDCGQLREHVVLPVPYAEKGDKQARFCDRRYPKKFPPEQFYIQQLKKLSALLHDVPMYAYIFTDDLQPAVLVERIAKAVNKQNITYDCQSEKFNYKHAVLEDFFHMTQFDCLIRPTSNFTKGVQLLGNHAVILFPIAAQWKDGTNKITHVGIIYNDVSRLINKHKIKNA